MKLYFKSRVVPGINKLVLSIGCIASIGIMLSMFFLFMSLQNVPGLIISSVIIALATYALLSHSDSNKISKINRSVFYVTSLLFLAITIPYAARKNFNPLHAIGVVAKNLRSTQKLIANSKHLPINTRVELVGGYLKLKLKNVIPYKKSSPEKVASFNMHHAKFQDLIALFEEVFIGNAYAFKADSQTPVVIDCGSNIGMTVLYFKSLYPKAKIMAFEPDKEAFETLKNNVVDNKLENVEIFNKALHIKNGTTTFYKSKDPADTMNSMFPSNYLDAEKEVVQTTRLSDYINKKVDLLKIDTEGAEHLIFQDLAENNKMKFIKEIIFEYHHHIEENVDKLSTMLKTLEDSGFGYSIKAGGSFSKESQGKQTNMLIYAYKK